MRKDRIETFVRGLSAGRVLSRRVRGLPLLGAVLVCALLSGCKSTDERLQDIGRSLDERWQLELSVYDAGQLVHEAYGHLVNQDELRLPEVALATWNAAQLVENSKVPLLRVDALSFLAHATARYPIPVPQGRLVERANLSAFVFEQARLLTERTEKLNVGPIHLANLRSPDRVQRDEALAELRRITGQDFGTDYAAWDAWWEEARGGFEAEAASELEGPIVSLGEILYPNLPSSRAVLGLLANTLPSYALPELEGVLARSLLTVARQVVEQAIVRGLSDDEPEVRAAAARAVMQVQAVAFGPALAEALGRETDPRAKVALLQAASLYPTRQIVRSVIFAQMDEDPAVRLEAVRLLDDLLLPGERLPADDLDSWALWWESTGKLRWP